MQILEKGKMLKNNTCTAPLMKINAKSCQLNQTSSFQLEISWHINSTAFSKLSRLVFNIK